MTFAIVSCPKCGLLQTTQILNLKTSTLNCSSCNKQTKIHKKDGSLVRIHATFDNPLDASRACMQMKGQELTGFKPALEK